ncbi:MAG: ribonuclease R [Planctomycetota bacterium]|jgi:ribonuclease R
MTEKKLTEGDQIEGTFYLGKGGVGYVRNKEIEHAIEIPTHQKNTAMHRDKVTAEVLSRNKTTGYTGKVLEILRHNEKGYAGVIKEKNGRYSITPDDIRDEITVFIPEQSLAGAQVAQRVFVTIDNWGAFPSGHVSRILEDLSPHEAKMSVIALSKGFDARFPEEVDAEAQSLKERGITEDDIASRRDMRSATTFTIDPDDAKDFDDALSLSKLENEHYEVGIHIADVSHYVRPGTALDEEAVERATSVYMVDRTIPMLPEVLSNELCSLRPGEDKLTYSAVFEIDEKGTVYNSWFGRTVINSDKRFTYLEAQEIMDGDGSGLFYREMTLMNSIAKLYTKERAANGALMLESDEIKFILDENGTPIEIRKKSRMDVHKMIEEFMLLANKKVAEFVANKEPPQLFLYRTHATPDIDRVKELEVYLKGLGYDVTIKNGIISSAVLAHILEIAETTDERDAMSMAIAKSMQKAIYTTRNIGHFGLGFDYYTHFTSPIRRYPDVMVHRLLTLALDNGELSTHDESAYNAMALHTSSREGDAAQAERASIKTKQIEYLSKHKGEIRTGMITGMNERGIFIRDRESYGEGMMRLGHSGIYRYDPKKNMLTGKGGENFSMGDIVQYRITRIDTEREFMDLELLGRS